MKVILFFSFTFLSLCTNLVESYTNWEIIQTRNDTSALNVSVIQPELNSSDMKANFEDADLNYFVHRTKRGIIWNKIKKVKSGIWSAKKKMWRIKQKAVEIAIGKDYETPKPYYESTGGSWGSFQKQLPKRNLHQLSGPPYSASTFKGVLPNSGESGWSKNDISSKNRGTSTKLTYADLLAIYRLPMNIDALRNFQKTRSRL